MPQQHELFEAQPLAVTPAPGAEGPRLWVKRLVIWKTPGGEKIRDIELAPGLNVVWSPDGAFVNSLGVEEKTIGHGSGKTLFCRLIRYCVGEDRFSTEEQRERIGFAFPDGIVGAEVMLDGTCWAVVRPLGVRRRHVAIANGNLDEIAAGEGSSTGVEPLIHAIEKSIITPAVIELVRARSEGAVWPVALAWLTRDQECRFDDVLDWRSPSSELNAPMPASGREKGPRLEALRAFLAAITPEERAARAHEYKLDEQRRTLEQEIGHRRWQLERTQARLATELGLELPLPEMPLLVDVMRKTAGERLAAASRLPAGGSSELAVAREELKAAQAEWTRLEGARARIGAAIPAEERVLDKILQELPGLSYSKVEAESPICPICEVPIDRALAEGCKLSHKVPDAEACRGRWAERKAEYEQQERTVQDLRGKLDPARRQVAAAKQLLDQRAERVADIEKAHDLRDSAWYLARRTQDDIRRLADRVTIHESAVHDVRELDKTLQSERDLLAAFRDKQARVFGRLGEKFDPIVRRLLGPNASGKVELTGKGLELWVDLGGDRKTAAIELLKVLAFDIASLCRSIEGATHVPAFLIHDSPREADLGLTIYHELFQLMRELEGQSGPPLFQYIVTTTSPPPDAFKADARLRLVIRGSPAHERLLKVDL